MVINNNNNNKNLLVGTHFNLLHMGVTYMFFFSKIDKFIYLNQQYNL